MNIDEFQRRINTCDHIQKLWYPFCIDKWYIPTELRTVWGSFIHGKSAARCNTCEKPTCDLFSAYVAVPVQVREIMYMHEQRMSDGVCIRTSGYSQMHAFSNHNSGASRRSDFVLCSDGTCDSLIHDHNIEVCGEVIFTACSLLHDCRV